MTEQSNSELVRGICGDCPFFDSLDYDQGDQAAPAAPTGAGVCRRNPPRHVQELEAEKVPETLISGIRPGLWPITRAIDFCGDHPLRVAAYQLGIEELRTTLIQRDKERRRAINAAARRTRDAAHVNPGTGFGKTFTGPDGLERTPPVGGRPGSKR